MNDKRTAIVKTALYLFINKGIHAVGINEIIKAANVAKKTLYHHFATKELLIIATLEYRDMLFMDWMKNSMRQGSDPYNSILALFYALDDWFNGRAIPLGDFHGCFFINAAAEYKQPDCHINQLCKAHKHNVQIEVEAYVKLITQDQQKVANITQSLCILKEGAITSALVQHDLSAAVKVIPLVKLLLDNQDSYGS